MDKDTFQLSGYEVIEKSATPHGNGAKVIVPKEWRNETVKIVRATDSDVSEEVVLSPLCVLLLDKLEMMDEYNFRELLRYGTRYKQFSDVPDDVVCDFEYCLNGPNTVDRLTESRNNTSSKRLTEFYQELIDNHEVESLVYSTLKDYI
jgi:hypothetical protein